jgi:predicted ABC-type ATPase
MSRQLWILAGGNGSGKSTFYRLYLKPRHLAFINADLIAEELFPQKTEEASQKAREEAQRRVEQHLQQGDSFCFETVFSHPSKVELIKRAKSFGYTVVLVYIHLRTSELNQARVIQRVHLGGHNVPAAKIRSRIPKTVVNIKKVLSVVDEAHLIDNSSVDNPLVRVATVIQNQIVYSVTPLPDWAQEMLKGI